MSHPGQSLPTRRHSTGHHPLLPKEQGIDDQRLSDNARLSQTTVTSQDVANGHKLEKSENHQVYLQAHILRRTRGSPIVPLPTTRRRHRRRKPPPETLLRSSVGPIAGRATTTPTRAGILLTLLLLLLPRHASGQRRKVVDRVTATSPVSWGTRTLTT